VENIFCVACDCETPHEPAAKNEMGDAKVCTKCGLVWYTKSEVE